MPGSTSSRPSRRRTSAWMHVQAQRAELAQQLAIEAGVQPQAFGDGQDDLPVRRREQQTSSATWMAVSRARFWWQEGQVQRCLQEKATNISCWQSGQRTRAKPCVQIAAA